ncbi:type VI secretion system protein TssL, long form [Elioraea rosea]|uniref:type VI secretion system protein TssL, long form n=1 Tax=Elioraea rosea TaxID=2492390 RepID=UPI001EF62570|nr:type VI secretion system protein TssL, long form [Elioraea rosea]
MVQDNPFSEPEDNDRTVIRPSPGGRRPAAAEPPAEPIPPAFDAAPQPPAGSADGAEAPPRIGVNPLAAAAAPLLDLIGRLRNTARPPDSGDLRERTIAGLRQFEQDARATGLAPEQLRAAHYALCATLDDVVLNTPWGSQGPWNTASLIATFHREVGSGDRFFQLLERLQKEPGKFKETLELMHLCISLGFQGRYRLSPRGPAELERIREGLYAVIQGQRPPAERELSPRWRGLAVPWLPPGRAVPLWVIGALALALMGGLYAWFAFSLNGRSDAVFAALNAVPPLAQPALARVAPPPPPPPPPPPEAGPDQITRIRTFLAPEIRDGLVAVVQTPQTIVVRIRASGMFGSGSATVSNRFVPILERIGSALKDEPGAVMVLGHSDNQPIRTVQFPSNWHLSNARAEAALVPLGRGIGDASRLKAEGRADAEPIADNSTAEGREQNRRIELVLPREELVRR